MGIAGKTFDACKVFSATTRQDRENLGETITSWLARHPEIDVVDIVIRQSSDARFHCISCVVFFRMKRN